MEKDAKWIRDIVGITTPMAFGELDLKVQRHRSKTTNLEISKSSTIMPKTNELAFFDLQKLLNDLVNGTFSGKLEFDIEYKKGMIKLITIKNKQVINYGSGQSQE